MSFDEYIRLGKGEEKANARNRASLLCDIFEALSGRYILTKGKAVVVSFITVGSSLPSLISAGLITT